MFVRTSTSHSPPFRFCIGVRQSYRQIIDGVTDVSYCEGCVRLSDSPLKLVYYYTSTPDSNTTTTNQLAADVLTDDIPEVYLD